MNIKPIRSEQDHKAALAEISKLMETDPDIGTPKGDRLDVLVTLVQAYEARHFPTLIDHRHDTKAARGFGYSCAELDSRSSAQLTA